MTIERGSARQTLVVDLLASERYFTSGEVLKVLRNRGVDRCYVLWCIANLRKAGSLDEKPDPTHKVRKLYRLKTISCDGV